MGKSFQSEGALNIKARLPISWTIADNIEDNIEGLKMCFKSVLINNIGVIQDG